MENAQKSVELSFPSWAAWLTVAAALAGIADAAFTFSGPGMLSPLIHMVPNNTLGFLAGGISLLLVGKRNNLSTFLALLVAALGAITFANYLGSLNWPLDALILKHGFGQEGSGQIYPGSMSPFTSVCFLLLGLSLFLSRFNKTVVLSQYVVFPVLFLGFITWVGFIYETVMRFGLDDFTPMALNTALLFIVFGLGVFLRHPNVGIARIIPSRALGGWTFRRLMPFAIGAPILIGWLQLQGEWSGYYDSAFRIAFMMVVLMLIMGGALWRVSFLLDRADCARQKAETDLRKRERFLSLLLETVPIPIFTKDTESNYVLVNKAFETLFWKKKEDFLGKSTFDANPKELAEIYVDHDQKVLATPGTYAYYSKVQDGLGVQHDVIFQKATLTDEDGKATGLIGTILDLSDQRRLEEELREANQRLEEADEGDAA